MATPLASVARSPRLRSVAASVATIGVPARRAGSGGRHLLLAPPGRGNIGDQALVEAFLENVDGPVTILTRGPHDVGVPDAEAERVEVVALPSLVYGRVLGHARDVRRFARLLRDAASLSVVGADIMDGLYVAGASIARADAAARAADAGVPSRVLGFSWNARPDRRAVSALERAQRAGVRLLVRDPVSGERLARDGLSATLAADIVFSARTSTDGLLDEVRMRVGDDRRFAILNASGLIREAAAPEYREVVSALRRRGLAVVVVPHVSRPGADDAPVCRQIVDDADDPSVVLVRRLALPAEIRGLARHAELTITGRMHLAIMSLMHQVPAITVATQGKVEGLMRSLDVEELCVEPGAGLGRRIGAIVERIGSDGSPRDRIAARLPELRRRAALNFADLPVRA